MRLSRRRKVALAVALTLAGTGLGSAAMAADGANDLGSKPVFVVRSDNTVDASVAGAAAARASAPLLYSSPDSLDGTTRDYLARYQPTSVVLVGGTKALSETVEASVKTLGYKPLRVTGADRTETAVKLGDLVASLPAAKGQKGDKGDPGSQGPAGLTGPAGSGAVKVKDANNVILGVVTDYTAGNDNISILTAMGYSVAFKADGSRDADRFLSYVSNDCSGTPLISANSSPPYQKTVYWLPRYNGYYTNEGQTVQTLTAASEYFRGVCTPSTNTGTYFAPVPITAAAAGAPSTLVGPLTLTTQWTTM